MVRLGLFRLQKFILSGIHSFWYITGGYIPKENIRKRILFVYDCPFEWWKADLIHACIFAKFVHLAECE